MSEWNDKPDEYWRKRQVLHENYLNGIVNVLGQIYPEFIQNRIIEYDNAWDKEMDKLDKEYTNHKGE